VFLFLLRQHLLPRLSENKVKLKYLWNFSSDGQKAQKIIKWLKLRITLHQSSTLHWQWVFFRQHIQALPRLSDFNFGIIVTTEGICCNF